MTIITTIIMTITILHFLLNSILCVYIIYFLLRCYIVPRSLITLPYTRCPVPFGHVHLYRAERDLLKDRQSTSLLSSNQAGPLKL